MRILWMLAPALLSFVQYGSAAAQKAPTTPQTVRGKWEHQHSVVANCDDSPVPGKRPSNWDCAVIARMQFSSLPPGPVVLHISTFPTREAAEPAASPSSIVVEAGGKVWLLALGSKTEKPRGGTFITDVGPFTVPTAARYEMVVSEADLGPELNSLPLQHIHPGPEIWYLLSGEQCLELPDRIVQARAGQGSFAPADTPMKLNIIGLSKRDAFFLVVHDPARPWVMKTDWKPKGLCPKQ